LHGPISRSVETDIPDHVQDNILGHHTLGQFAFQVKAHRFRHFYQKFAGAQNKTGVRVSYSGGKFAEGPRHASVRIGPEKNFSRSRVTTLRQGGVTYPLVSGAVLPPNLSTGRIECPVAIRIVNHIVEIG
jgi:hypothetical protein